MAVFSKEPENPKSTEALKPTMPAVSGVTSPAAPGEARAYLDKGSKIMGKLFEGPVRIDGQVDGEISANDVVVIGESAVVTAPQRRVGCDRGQDQRGHHRRQASRDSCDGQSLRQSHHAGPGGA
jgi:hypothetical protein